MNTPRKLYLVESNKGDEATHVLAPTTLSDGQEEEELQVGLLRLHRGRYEVFYGKVQLSLTPKEFSMLELLMSKEGHLVTYHTMLQAFFPEHERLEAADIKDLMRQRVHQLRRKIRAHSKQDMIQSVWGMGYKIMICLG